MNMNTNQTKLHTLGIDIGSTTVKVAILNEKNELPLIMNAIMPISRRRSLHF